MVAPGCIKPLKIRESPLVKNEWNVSCGHRGFRGRVVKVTQRQPGLKRFIERGDNLRLNEPAPESINQVWASDITYIKVRDTYKCLIVIIDFSRRILSWPLTETRTTKDTRRALKRAI